jgi:hypothetical protein
MRMVAMTVQDNEIVEMLGFMGLAISTALAVAFFSIVTTGSLYKPEVIILFTAGSNHR